MVGKRVMGATGYIEANAMIQGMERNIDRALGNNDFPVSKGRGLRKTYFPLLFGRQGLAFQLLPLVGSVSEQDHLLGSRLRLK